MVTKFNPNKYIYNMKLLYEGYFAKVGVNVFGDHGLGYLLEEGTHEKSPKCLSGNLGEFCKDPDRLFHNYPSSGSLVICTRSMR